LDESGAWLATTPATVVQRRLTLAAIVALLLIFVAVVAFSNVPLLQSDGFIPFIQGTMFVTELATAVLLYAQFALVLSLLGFIRNTSRDESVELLAAMRQGLKKTGYVEGKNLAIEYRFADNQLSTDGC
jgi:hypothetical protein